MNEIKEEINTWKRNYMTLECKINLDIVVQLLNGFWLCDPMNYSMSGFLILHYLPEFAQTHVHWVHDAIQPFHSLLPPFLLPSIFPSIRVFSNFSKLALCIRWPKYWSFSFGISPSNEYSGWICFFIFHTGMFKLRDTCGICWRLHCPVVILKNAIQVLALNVLAFYPPTHLPS